MPIPVYPLDLTGNALTNHIVGEVRAITSNIERFIVPVGGPFYTVTMVVRNNVTNAILLPNTQYKILHHIPEASQDSGKNVCAVVYITDATVPAVRLEYQVVGGQYQNMVPLIAQLISEHPLDPNAPDQIGWGQIFGMPNQYPPTAHIHPANQFLGYADLVMALENLRVAVANGDNLAISAIYRYIELMFSSSQYVTADQLNSLLITPEPFVKVHPTYAALKQRDDMVANLAVVYATIGRAQSNDGLGMLFRWDSLSTATPDEKYILRPNHILGNDPGRFVSLLWTQNVLDRHGIDAAVAAFSMVPDNADLDTLKTPSKMWVRNTQANRPFDYGVLEITLVAGALDQPAEVHQRMYWDHREATRNCNHLGVWSVWTFVKSRFLVIERNLNTNAVDLDTVVEPNDYYYGDDCPNRPTQYGLLNVRIETHDIVYHTAHGADNTVHTRYRANNGTWTRWKKLMDEVEMERHGINTAIALHNQLAVNVNLDNVLTPGKFYIGNHTEPSPGLHGILEVELISGTLDAPGEAEQTFKRSSSTSLFATRRRYWNGTTYVWGQWMFRAMRNGETDQVFHAAAPAIGTEQGTHVVNIAMQNAAFALLWNRLTINGIDADLAVTNMLDNVDLNGVTAVGDYYYTPTCSNKPPLYGDYGLMEVRREYAEVVYQKVHTYENWYCSRYRASNGVWTPWRRYADADAFDTFVTNTNSALGTLSSAVAGINETAKNGALGGSYTSYIPGTHSIILAPGEAIRIVLFGAGGGGGGYGIDGGNGGSTEFRDGFNVIFSAYGGQGGFKGYAAGSNTYTIDPPERSQGGFNREYGFQHRVRGINPTNLPSWTDNHGFGGNSDGVSFSNMRIASHGGKSGCIDAEYVNPNDTPQTYTLYVPNGGAAANSAATDGDVGRAYIFRGK